MEFPYGTIDAEIPPYFYSVEQWPEYGLIASPPSFCSREEVGGNPKGIRWRLWPIAFEQYISDTEPNLAVSARGKLASSRQIIWNRVRRTDIPTGWHQSSDIPAQVDGYKQLTDDPTSGWNHDARKSLRVWMRRHADKTHRIGQVQFPEYRAAYAKSLIANRLDQSRVKVLARKLELPEVAANTELWGIRDLASGHIVAGTALIHSPTYRGSTHFAPFIHQEARKIHGATALIHHWFTLAQARRDVFVTTTNFWFPGKPDSWKGFSEFKSHFGWRYIAYPPELTRFVRGRLF